MLVSRLIVRGLPIIVIHCVLSVWWLLILVHDSLFSIQGSPQQKTSLTRHPYLVPLISPLGHSLLNQRSPSSPQKDLQ
ncbi:hypothetical protein SK128_006521, partial [Halocaridina rubra]